MQCHFGEKERPAIATWKENDNIGPSRSHVTQKLKGAHLKKIENEKESEVIQGKE